MKRFALTLLPAAFALTLALPANADAKKKEDTRTPAEKAAATYK